MMTPATPVDPPGQAQQWTHDQLRAAKRLGRHDLIAQAHAAGQLDAILRDPADLGQQSANSGASSPISGDAVGLAAAQAITDRFDNETRTDR